MPKKIILAVAVGDSDRDRQIDRMPTSADLDGIRPYIKGLTSWLANHSNPPPPGGLTTNYTCGQQYKILYRERSLDELENDFPDTSNADLIFCMSTTVAHAAERAAPNTPIVAIVSDPYGENFGPYVCGVSASRDRVAMGAFKEFDKHVGDVYALHREGYPPSTKAKGWLAKKVTPVSVPDSANDGEFETIVKGTVGSNRGLLVLPADRFFGHAKKITEWTGTMRTFWFTPDFPTEAFGGYGYAQELCGRYMAERVARIWANNNGIPDDPWVLIDRDPTLRITARKKKPRAKLSATSSARKQRPKASTRAAKRKK